MPVLPATTHGCFGGRGAETNDMALGEARSGSIRCANTTGDQQMSREVMAAAIRGATAFVHEARTKLDEAIAARGADHPVEFPATAFQLPMIHALMGLEITRLGQLSTSDIGISAVQGWQ